MVDLPQLIQIRQQVQERDLQRLAQDRRRNAKGSAFALDENQNNNQFARATEEAAQPLRRKTDIASIAAAVLRGLGSFLAPQDGKAPGGLAGALGYEAQRIAQESPIAPQADERNAAISAYREAGRRGQLDSGPEKRLDIEI